MKSIIYSGQHVAHQCSISESSFDDVNLQYSVFNNINLQKSIFTSINFGHSNFYDMNLNGSKFSYVNLAGVSFTNITSTCINHLGLSKQKPIRFSDSDLSESVFSSINFRNATFEDCDIKGLVINGVNIEALMNGDSDKAALVQVGWRTQNDTGSTNKISKKHYMISGNNKTLCGVEVPDKDKVAEMAENIGKGDCKRCLNIKKSY